MPNWKDVLVEIQAAGSPFDIVRRKHLADLSAYTGRNTIVYYSGWLQKSHLNGRVTEVFSVNDSDKNGFMASIHKLDRSKGLDLVLHTPGGGIAATESLVDYLRAMFGNDIRAIVPQLAMSAGTMIALSCKSVVMGKHSSLGPIDPQIGGVAAHGVIEEFKTAVNEVRKDPSQVPIWQALISKYPAAFVQRCEKAIQWSEELVTDWLKTNMLLTVQNGHATAGAIVSALGTPSIQKSHDRHISAASLAKIGVIVEDLEKDQALQDRVLTLHHACIQTLTMTAACKIIENQDGMCFIQAVQTSA